MRRERGRHLECRLARLPAKTTSQRSYLVTRNLLSPGWHSLCCRGWRRTTVPYPRITMQVLSTLARFILDRLEPDRHYEALDLRALVPDASAERLGEVMHELWVNRQVERVGHSGWQRRRSAPPNQKPVDAQLGAADVGPVSGRRQTKVVKPEDLFDHALFEDFFR